METKAIQKNISIDIPEHLTDKVISALEREAMQLEEIMDALKDQLKKTQQDFIECQSLINTIRNKKEQPESPSINGNGNHYSDEWTWPLKIKYVLKTMKRPLTTNEIAEAIGHYENKPVTKSSIFSAINGLYTRKELRRTKPGIEYLYDLPESNNNKKITNDEINDNDEIDFPIAIVAQ